MMNAMIRPGSGEFCVADVNVSIVKNAARESVPVGRKGGSDDET